MPRLGLGGKRSRWKVEVVHGLYIRTHDGIAWHGVMARWDMNAGSQGRETRASLLEITLAYFRPRYRARLDRAQQLTPAKSAIDRQSVFNYTQYTAARLFYIQIG